MAWALYRNAIGTVEATQPASLATSPLSSFFPTWPPSSGPTIPTPTSGPPRRVKSSKEPSLPLVDYFYHVVYPGLTGPLALRLSVVDALDPKRHFHVSMRARARESGGYVRVGLLFVLPHSAEK
jgi:hypothetical protein